MKLKATKTSMYQLCKTYIPNLPAMINTNFRKAYRRPSWWMTFDTPDEIYHEMRLITDAGKVILIDESSEWSKEKEKMEYKKSTDHKLTIDQLRSLNMIQD